MSEKETIEKYRKEVVENEKSIAQMKRRMPWAILIIIIAPIIFPFIPYRGKVMNDNLPYFMNVIICFLLFSLMYVAIYFGTINNKRRQIHRLNVWIKQIVDSE